MSKERTATDPLPDNPQTLVGFMTNEEWDELLAHVNHLITEMEELPLPEVKDSVFNLLAGIDAIHREGLRRLVRLFKEGVMEQVVTDPAIHTLMELYDLLPEDTEEPPPEPVQKAAEHFRNIPIKVVPRETPQRPTSMYPHWVPALKNKKELAPGALRALRVDAHQVLLCRVNDDFFAIENACAQDATSLEQATLNNFTLSCPNHRGCYYDIRNGIRIAGNESIFCYPVQVTPEDNVMIGIDMAFEPRLPTF